MNSPLISVPILSRKLAVRRRSDCRRERENAWQPQGREAIVDTNLSRSWSGVSKVRWNRHAALPNRFNSPGVCVRIIAGL